jgi:hypothetical protein
MPSFVTRILNGIVKRFKKAAGFNASSRLQLTVYSCRLLG